jgi:hypothetical protein
VKAILNVLETRLLRRPGWLRFTSAPAILVSDGGFTVGGLTLPWDAVSRIRARRDLHGDICLDVVADVDAGIITLSETQRGFDDVVAMADRKLTFPLGWWDHLDAPGTRRQGLTLFERKRRTSSITVI